MTARTLALLLCANTVALMIVVALWCASGPGRSALTLLAIAPLMLPLPGLWRGSRYTAAWASLLVIPYMLFGVVEVVADPAVRPIAGVELAVSFLLFAGLLVLARGGRRRFP
ncbi:MAG: DUF2069 domain-containing protein [Gammaproteobacteria bacterium]